MAHLQQRFTTEQRWHSEDGFGFRAVTRENDHTLLGLMGFQRYREDGDTGYIVFADGSSPVGKIPNFLEVELTYAFGRAYWKQRYATEAGKAVIADGFRRLGINRIVNSVRPTNFNTINVMRRLGFHLEHNHNPEYRVKFGTWGILGMLEDSTKTIV